MKLSEYCKKITKQEADYSGENEKIGRRIMCPEYSVDQAEIKTFPHSEQEDIFILLWRLEQEGYLYATIKPSKSAFTYLGTFLPGSRTQIHTHDYIELAYVVEGEFKQRILGRDINFSRGEICLIDKNCLHQDYLSDSKCTVIFIGLANEVFDEAMVSRIEEEGILNFLRMALMKQKDIQQYVHFKPKNADDSQIEFLLLNLLTELECNDEASKFICKGLLIRILHHISTKYDFYLSNEQRKKMNWIIFEDITNILKKGIPILRLKSWWRGFILMRTITTGC